MKQIQSGVRLESIDFLRGLVLVLMVLDHTRDFFHASPQDPTSSSDPYIFFFRWITHFCAPVFLLLTGISAYLYGSNGKSKYELARYLITRGLWLVFAELFIVRFAWMFNFDYSYFLLQVIFVIGFSMIALAGIVFLPKWLAWLMTVTVIVGHNLLDSISIDINSQFGYFWSFLHVPSTLNFGGNVDVNVLYPVLPWFSVVTLGYLIGPIYKIQQKERVNILVTAGVVVALAFVVLRLTNYYGNPTVWDASESYMAATMSFLNVQKYPPSLLYLMMTLGPALIFLGCSENAKGRIVNLFVTFGHVPFFFYISHLFLVHSLALLYAKYTGVSTVWLYGPFPGGKPLGYGVNIFSLIPIWIVVLTILYPLCKWYGNFKRNNHWWWLSYL